MNSRKIEVIKFDKPPSEAEIEEKIKKIDDPKQGWKLISINPTEAMSVDRGGYLTYSYTILMVYEKKL